MRTPKNLENGVEWEQERRSVAGSGRSCPATKMLRSKWFQSLAVLAVLSGCVSAGEGTFYAEGDPEEGAKVFLNRCKVCHWIGQGAKNRRGPHLNGVVGRKIASVEGFDYSDAFLSKKAEGLVWTEANLHAHLTDPQRFIPGTTMSFPGVQAREDRADLIAYLARYP